MNEDEKLLAGKLANPREPALAKRQQLAHRLSKLYNDTFEDEMEKRRQLLKQLLPNTGKRIYFQGPIFLITGPTPQLVNVFMATPISPCWTVAE